MSLSTTTPPAPTSVVSAEPVRGVVCDAPGCGVAAPLLESGAKPAGWHTLEMAAQPGIDPPQWHFHTPQCVVQFMASVHGALIDMERYVNEAYDAAGAHARASEQPATVTIAAAPAESETAEPAVSAELAAEPEAAPAESDASEPAVEAPEATEAEAPAEPAQESIESEEQP